MVSTQDPALVVTPGLYQYNTTLEQMVLIYQIINLKKKKLQFSEETNIIMVLFFQGERTSVGFPKCSTHLQKETKSAQPSKLVE